MKRRSKVNLGHRVTLSFDMGELIPVGIFEVLPGDTIQQSTTALIRLQPLFTPVMTRMDVHIHHFFVPTRLVWANFERFITGGANNTDTTAHPVIGITGVTSAVGSLADYLGIPAINQQVSALPFRAYNLIWNEYYRDQDLQTALTNSTGDGLDTTSNVALQNVCWAKDYFGLARPTEQKGPAVTIPLGTTAPVHGLVGVPGGTVTPSAAPAFGVDAAGDLATGSPLGNIMAEGQTGAGMGGTPWSATNRPQIFADLSNASGATLSQLRLAYALQQVAEARSRYGSRYSEYLAYLGVTVRDRPDRPELLSGSHEPLQVSEVLQTAEGTNPVGTLRGHGIGTHRSNTYRRYFDEHGYVMSMLFVRPKAHYFQGLHRMWNRRTRNDYWQPELEHIGQQAMLVKEIFANTAIAENVFGFVDRYQEYREGHDRIAGEMRSTLNTWHLGREFASPPALNASFVRCVPSERIFPAPTADVVYATAQHRIVARRLVSQYGNPKSVM